MSLEELAAKSSVTAKYHATHTSRVSSPISQFESALSSFQSELKQKFLISSTVFDDIPTNQQQNKFIESTLNSAYGKQLVSKLSQIIANVATTTLNQQNIPLDQMRLLLKSQLLSILRNGSQCDNDGDDDDDDITQSQYSKPFRNVETLRLVSHICKLDCGNGNLDERKKWILQLLYIDNECDPQLQSQYFLELSQILANESMNVDWKLVLHCIRESQKLDKNFENLMAEIVVMSELDSLELAEPLLESIRPYCDNGSIVLLKCVVALFEYLMEETNAAIELWDALKSELEAIPQNNADTKSNTASVVSTKAVSPNNDDSGSVNDTTQLELGNMTSFYECWAAMFDIAKQYNCTKLCQIIFECSQNYFENSIEAYLITNQWLIYNNQNNDSIQCLGKAIFINDHSIQAWLAIGKSYQKCDKIDESIKAYQRYIDECQKSDNFAEISAEISLIQLYIKATDFKSGLAQIENCDTRINECESISDLDRNAYRYYLTKAKALCLHGNNDIKAALYEYSVSSNIHPFNETLFEHVSKALSTNLE